MSVLKLFLERLVLCYQTVHNLLKCYLTQITTIVYFSANSFLLLEMLFPEELASMKLMIGGSRNQTDKNRKI